MAGLFAREIPLIKIGRWLVRSLDPSAEQPQPCTVLTPQASAYSKHTADNKLKIQNTAASGRNLLAYRV